MQEFERKGDYETFKAKEQLRHNVAEGLEVCNMFNGQDSFTDIRPTLVNYEYYENEVKRDRRVGTPEFCQALETAGIHVMLFEDNYNNETFSIPVVSDGRAYANALNDVLGHDPLLNGSTREGLQAAVECPLELAPFIIAKAENEKFSSVYGDFREVLVGARTMDHPLTDFDTAIHNSLQQIGKHAADIRLGLREISGAISDVGLDQKIAVFQKAYREDSLLDYTVAKRLDLLPRDASIPKISHYYTEELHLLQRLLRSQTENNAYGQFADYLFHQTIPILDSLEEEMNNAEAEMEEDRLMMLMELRVCFTEWVAKRQG